MFFSKFSKRIDQLFLKIEPWMGAPLLALEYIIFCIYVPIKQRLGFANLEAYAYIPAHLNAKGKVLSNIFDAKMHDSMGFQNRNLSFLIDYWDVQALGWFLKAGHPHFISISHFIGVGIILFGLWHLFQNVFYLDRAISFLICNLVLFTPVFNVTASYSRSAKIGAGIAVFIFSCVSLRLMQNKVERLTTLFLLWVAALLFSFFDMLAISFCLYFGLISVAFIFLEENSFFAPRIKTTILFFGSVIVLNQAFGRFAVPAIHEHFFGNRFYFSPVPSGRFSNILQHPMAWFSDIAGNFVDQIRFFLGTFPFAIGVLIVFILLFAAFDFAKQRYGKTRAYCALLALLLPIFGLLTILKIGHDPIYHELFRRLYYPIPFQVLIAVGAGFFLQNVAKYYGPQGLKCAKLCLWTALLGSLSAVNGHVDIVRGSYLAPVIASSPKILAALRAYARTRDESSVNDEARQNSLYQSLRQYIDKSDKQ